MSTHANDADNHQWHIGGYDHTMSQEDQLEQLYSHLEAHFHFLTSRHRGRAEVGIPPRLIITARS